MEYLHELLGILNEMSPYLILGFLISGILHIYVPKTLYARFLQRKGAGSVVGAAILGIPLPLCSCGVIPTAMSLKKEGASDGAVISFLVGTPQTGIDSILATYGLLGLPFAIIRPIGALFVSIFGGILVDWLGVPKKKKRAEAESGYSFVGVSSATEQCDCGCQTHNHNHAHSHTDGTCDCCSHTEGKKSFGAALKYGYVYMMEDFGKWLVIGLLIAAAITAFVPDSVFAIFQDHYFLNIILILIISAPMYICATGSIPIAMSLIMMGVSPGAAFVLLMAGPATNLASLIILRREIGVRKVVIYLISIVIGAIICAMIIDFVLPQEWFDGMRALGGHCHEGHAGHECHEHIGHDHSHGLVWWQTLSSAIFVVLFVSAMVRKYFRKRK